ncbi:uncharacterized protein NDAI_0A07090 [Naumovozyma dairenensis CBS 421]|uniref:Uncharacterized protein n=1 Tax=Naumovozyma dairenensis (strain ATCC 10597 / BCRC 20456 / CBS 421 / NBRC 0211 / NRRL Y-12639) TaxID=1071378 RepID=G0W4X5_NAUDC|nr:hypothetical protein NDAI_0A07090 [Naumovozyma dairenensis CBS 421]CCD22863.1 hypothetical protein NDAI_0A07090 [Naumovozyma dairenensis CBS 421]
MYLESGCNYHHLRNNRHFWPRYFREKEDISRKINKTKTKSQRKKTCGVSLKYPQVKGRVVYNYVYIEYYTGGKIITKQNKTIHYTMERDNSYNFLSEDPPSKRQRLNDSAGNGENSDDHQLDVVDPDIVNDVATTFANSIEAATTNVTTGTTSATATAIEGTHTSSTHVSNTENANIDTSLMASFNEPDDEESHEVSNDHAAPQQNDEEREEETSNDIVDGTLENNDDASFRLPEMHEQQEQIVFTRNVEQPHITLHLPKVDLEQLSSEISQNKDIDVRLWNFLDSFYDKTGSYFSSYDFNVEFSSNDFKVSVSSPMTSSNNVTYNSSRFNTSVNEDANSTAPTSAELLEGIIQHQSDPHFTASNNSCNNSNSNDDNNQAISSNAALAITDKKGTVFNPIDISTTPMEVQTQFEATLKISKFGQFYDKILIKCFRLPQSKNVFLKNGYQVCLICKFCKHSLLLTSSSTGNAAKHIGIHTGNEFLSVPDSDIKKNSSPSDSSLSSPSPSSNNNSTINTNNYPRKVLTKAMIVGSTLEKLLKTKRFQQLRYHFTMNQSLNFSLGYRLNIFEQQITMKEQVTIKRYLFEVTELFKLSIKNALLQSSLVSITLGIRSNNDMTDPTISSSQLPSQKYMVILANFVPNLTQLKPMKNRLANTMVKNNHNQTQCKAVLGVIDVSNQEFLNNSLSNKILEIFNYYGIQSKILSITSENNYNEFSLGDELYQKLATNANNKKLISNISSKFFNINCFKTTISMVLKNTFHSLHLLEPKLFDQLNKLSRHTRSVASLKNEYLNFVKRLLPVSDPMEPMSQLILLHRFVEDWPLIENFAKTMINSYPIEYVEMFKFSTDSIKKLKFISKILNSFYQLILSTNYDHTNSIITTLYSSYNIINYYKVLSSIIVTKVVTNDDNDMFGFMIDNPLDTAEIAIIQSILDNQYKFQNFFKNLLSENLLISICDFLNPFSKLSFTKQLTETNNSGLLTNARVLSDVINWLLQYSDIMNETENYFHTVDNIRTNSSTIITAPHDQHLAINSRSFPILVSGVDPQHEIIRYLKEPISIPPSSGLAATKRYFTYWMKNKNSFPTLAALALHLLYTKGSSIDIDRVFSMSGWEFNWKEPNDEKIVDSIVTLRHNDSFFDVKRGIRSTIDDPLYSLKSLSTQGNLQSNPDLNL